MKECASCKKLKNTDDFYKHKPAKDGLLNKCKSCCIIQAKERIIEKSKDQLWAEKERERQREKYRRLDYKGKYKRSNEKRNEVTKKYFDKFPEKRETHNKSTKIKTKKGYNNHHWSYKKEHSKDVIEMTINEHRNFHRFLIYDQESKLFRDIDGNLLDTRIKHLNYFNNKKHLFETYATYKNGLRQSRAFSI